MLSELKTPAAAVLRTDPGIMDHPLPTWLVSSKDLSIRSSNKAAAACYLFSTEEFLEMSFLDLFTETGKVEFFNKAAQSGQAEHLNGIYRHLKKDGTEIIVQVFAVALDHEGSRYYEVSAIDQTQWISRQQQLEEENRRYKTYIDQTTEGIFCQEFRTPVPVDLPVEDIFALSKKNCYLSECNDAMARMYGFEKAEELKGLLSEQMIDLSDPANIDYMRSFIENGFRVTNAESHEKDRYGQSKYFLNNAIGIIENGHLVRIWGRQQDITERKKAEERSRLLANLVEQTSDVLTAADPDYKPVTWNKAAESIYGLKATQVIGRDLREFIDIQYPNTNREQVREAINTQGEWRGEAVFVRPTDGKTVTLWMCFKLLRGERNERLGFLISATDITERKAAESRLRESENRFREMADSSPVMIWMGDEKKIPVYFNKKFLEFTGQDVTGDPKGWLHLIHPADVEQAMAEYNAACQEKKPVRLFYRLRYADGRYHWVHDVSVPRFSAGRFVGYIGSIIDVEDQKQKEEQLLYQATILENVSDIVFTTDMEFRVRVWNKIAEAYYGISETEAVGKKIGDLVRFRFYDSSLEDISACLQEKGFWQGELSTDNGEGQTTFFLYTIKFIYDARQQKIGCLAVGRDITEKKLADEKMRKSEEFYRTLIADSLDGILLVDLNGTITFASPSVKNVLGYEVEDVVGKNGFGFIHPEDLFWAATSFKKEIEENPEVKFIVVRLLKKNGDWVWCMLRGHNMLDNPSIRSVVVYFHDDSLRKQATDALKESEKRFRNLTRDLQIGVFLSDRNGRITLCNKAIASLLSTTEEEITGRNFEEFLNLNMISERGEAFHKEDLPLLKSMRDKTPVKDFVIGIKHPQTGERFWILINATPVLDERGDLKHLVTSVMDITERKKLEQELVTRKIHHQRQLTQATIDGQEAERREIGKELHDNIGQQLTTIKLFLDLARSTANENTAGMIDMALKGVSGVINEVRAISRSLIPPTLQDLGLVESIQELVESISRTQLLEVGFEHPDFDESILPDNQKLTLFRIVQEQLNNIVKHSGAKEVSIRLQSNEKEISLVIRDDGKGFDPGSVKKGLGFINIRNRAELFGGKKRVTTSPGKGCTLRVVFPRPERNKPQLILPNSLT